MTLSVDFDNQIERFGFYNDGVGLDEDAGVLCAQSGITSADHPCRAALAQRARDLIALHNGYAISPPGQPWPSASVPSDAEVRQMSATAEGLRPGASVFK